MTSLQTLSHLLQKYQESNPKACFNADDLAEYLCSMIFEEQQKTKLPISTIIESALLVLHGKMSRTGQDILLEVLPQVTAAHGFGLRAVDCGGVNPLAEALIRLAQKVVA